MYVCCTKKRPSYDDRFIFLRGSLMPIAASIPAVITTKVCPNFRNDENKIFPFCAPFIPFDAEDDTFERRRRLFAIEYLMPL